MSKRLVGGLFLLNLCVISLNLTAGEVDIENEEVLDQLKQLRSFIDEKRDFTKGFKDLKPVLVQYRSSASKIDGIVACNLSFNTDALHLSIGGKSLQADGSVIDIVINVVFEFEEYVGYKIKSAKLNASLEIIPLPEVTADDNGNVLGVVDGEWAKMSLNGKYVRIKDLPTSQFLTNEQLELIDGGLFTIGQLTISGKKLINPIFTPTNISGNIHSGIIISSTGLYSYSINTANNNYMNINLNLGIRIDGINGRLYINEKQLPSYPADTDIGQFICRKGTLEFYVPVAVTGITSGDDLVDVQNDLVNAMKDHLEVEINGHRCRFEREDSTHVIYSWKDETDNGVNLQINMISLLIASPNTISFNLMKFAPVV